VSGGALVIVAGATLYVANGITDSANGAAPAGNFPPLSLALSFSLALLFSRPSPSLSPNLINYYHRNIQFRTSCLYCNRYYSLSS
jgi:hypothetical protein